MIAPDPTGPRGAGLPRPGLGFGGAYLVGALHAHASRRLVDVAFERGVRHFDVAPSYGLGTAEAVLGSALHKRRDAVTITTKVGLPGARLSLPKLLLRSAAAPLRARFPSLGRGAPGPAAGAAPAAASPRQARFDLGFVRGSVEESLRRLRTDHVDVLLLHEAWPEDVTEELVRYLEDGRAAGRFRAIGIGSDRGHNQAIVARWPGVFDVVQHSWSVLDRAAPAFADDVLTITHRAVMGALQPLRARLADQAFCRAGSEATGTDLADPRRLAPLLLGAALAANPAGLALIGSRSQGRLLESLAILDDPGAIAAGGRLRAFLARPA